jgi:hypothetical protein
LLFIIYLFRNGGVAFGRFVKLFGKVAPPDTDAIALALRIANGFFPVSVVYPRLDFCLLSLAPILPALLAPAPYTKPSVSVLLLEPLVLVVCPINSVAPIPICGRTSASLLNCSTRKRTSRMRSIGTR